MRWSELIREIKNAGWQLERTAKGSHQIYRHPDFKDPIIIAYHANKEVPPGLANSLLKKAGVK